VFVGPLVFFPRPPWFRVTPFTLPQSPVARCTIPMNSIPCNTLSLTVSDFGEGLGGSGSQAGWRRGGGLREIGVGGRGSAVGPSRIGWQVGRQDRRDSAKAFPGPTSAASFCLPPPPAWQAALAGSRPCNPTDTDPKIRDGQLYPPIPLVNNAMPALQATNGIPIAPLNPADDNGSMARSRPARAIRRSCRGVGSRPYTISRGMLLPQRPRRVS